MTLKRLGLIAGNGKFPILFAQKAKSQNYQVIAAGIKGDTSFMLKPFVSQLSVFPVGELDRIFSYLKEQGCTEAVMAGQVNPEKLFDESIQLDDQFQQLFQALRDRKADTIFSALAEKLKEYDIELMDSTFLLKEYLAPKGTLTRRAPSENQLADMAFGREIAKAMGKMDVGQTVVVKDKAIVAIEAMEGTDQTILRGGKISREGAVVVKMSKPDQDLRFDVPVIGPRTIKHMMKSNCVCLAIEAGKTIIIDRDKVIKMANKAKICIVAV